jgi:hypothetical protein
MQAHAVSQFRSHYQLIILDSVCPFACLQTPACTWLPEIPGRHNFHSPLDSASHGYIRTVAAHTKLNRFRKPRDLSTILEMATMDKERNMQ